MPDNRQSLLAWAAGVISREMGRHTTGEVRIQLHEGSIQRIRTEATEKPPKTNG